MDQHNMLRVLCGKCGFEVEGTQHFFALVA
jgi:ribosomal protein S27AE